jgi:cathepsin X
MVVIAMVVLTTRLMPASTRYELDSLSQLETPHSHANNSFQFGIPDETCAPYQAVNGLSCQPTCKTCWPGNNGGNCVNIDKFSLYKASEYGSVSGVAAMKKEIYARGPIACGIDATPNFDKYTGGIYSEFTYPEINHIISVVGWGKDPQSGQEYWIGRNSWGTYWGETGWFRITMGNSWYNLGIEEDCAWAVPDSSTFPTPPAL